LLSEPETNIRIGCWYLNYLNGLFDGNDDYMIAAYNAGQGNVQEWIKTDETLESIPFPETENYLKKVKAFYEIYKGLYHL
jgi:soluble lytic murein transglycosylase